MSKIFGKIAKVNKQKVQKVENELFILKTNIRQIEKKIKNIYTDIDTLDIPKNGEARVLALFQERRKLLNNQKSRYQLNLNAKNLELANKYQEYKKAKLEYEKIKYLNEQEISKKVKKMKKEEQKNLDEISNMLYKGVAH
jgi:chromosome segregation ATPase